MVGVEAVDPGIHLGRIYDTAGGDIGAGLGDAFGLPSETDLPLGFSLRAHCIGAISRRWNRIHGRECNSQGQQLPAL